MNAKPAISAGFLLFKFYKKNKSVYNECKIDLEQIFMMISLSGPWQLSPLSDLSIPQNDMHFPGPFSTILPSSYSEESIAGQEWHLMHDIEVDDNLLQFKAIDFVLSGITSYVEVRLNGFALFDCDGQASLYKQDIRPILKLGRNRFELLFIEPDDDLFIDEAEDGDCGLCTLGQQETEPADLRVGIWREPYLQLIANVRLNYVTVEQIWHHSGCELLVTLHFTTLAMGLISALVKFDGLTYSVPLDVRSNHASALFQIDAPKYYDTITPNVNDLYQLTVQLDGQELMFNIGLSEDLCVSHFPI